jgi:phosphatidylglycerol:prolipoprotein diacylglycerol transferase
MNFLHTYIPQAIAFSAGPITIYWYGIIMAIAIALGILLSLHIAKKREISSELVIDAAIWTIVGGLIGARVYEFFLEWNFYSQAPFEILKIWNGGLAIHGALIGGAIALFIFLRRNSIYNIWNLAAVFLPGVALGQAIGRFGNYFNQELFGKPTNLPWGIPINPFHRPLGFETFEYFHPTFLYEAKLLIILALILYFFARKKDVPCAYIAAIYLIGYGVIRFSLEFIKIDPTPIILSLR